MELADVTDSKSVGSNTVRVRPPPSAPKIIPRSTSGVLFLVRREGEPATCGSCMDARWRSHKVGARTHKDSHTEPLHDATAQMAVDAQMWQPKRPQTQGCVIVLAQSFARMRNQKSKHDSTTPLHFRRLNKRGIIFGAGGGRTRNLRVRHGGLIK